MGGAARSPGPRVAGVTVDPEWLTREYGLQPHPTCGFYAETYRSALRIPQAALPEGYEGDRPVGTALHFLVTDQVTLRVHRVRSDQQYQHHLGAALEVLLLLPDGTSEQHVVGPDLEAGQVPMLFIPGHTFHVSKLLPGGSWAFLSATGWPGVEPPDFELGDVDELRARFPDAADTLRRLTS